MLSCGRHSGVELSLLHDLASFATLLLGVGVATVGGSWLVETVPAHLERLDVALDSLPVQDGSDVLVLGRLVAEGAELLLPRLTSKRRRLAEDRTVHRPRHGILRMLAGLVRPVHHRLVHVLVEGHLFPA